MDTSMQTISRTSASPGGMRSRQRRVRRNRRHAWTAPTASRCSERSWHADETRVATARSRTVAPRSESVARTALTVIRVLIGGLFVACGFGGLLGVLPNMHAHAELQGSVAALGGAIVLAGSMLPLLKGIEVIVAALLDLYQSATKGS
jgi:hypothetical protein